MNTNEKIDSYNPISVLDGDYMDRVRNQITIALLMENRNRNRWFTQELFSKLF